MKIFENSANTKFMYQNCQSINVTMFQLDFKRKEA